MPADTETAYAKINLALHVRRRREDGYHDIETLFAFAQHGDQLQASLADTLELSIDGPFGSGLSVGDDNLVMQTANRLRAHFSISKGASIRLTKNLPIASGIGGGSADAAAAARLLNRLWDIQASEQELADILAPLGADIPACVFSRTSFGSGTGTAIELRDDSNVPARHLLLVNPLQSVSTAAIFKAWDGKDQGPVARGDIWQATLSGRNDLEPIAAAICPAITDILNILARANPAMVRMSGSGATCFALFNEAKDLDAAKANLDPRWWSMGTELR
ncbi:MAG: 4-(cytidine 5'-diphospho)-2-C-methyl-D-erythritol kinase [Sphingomonadales bacterium 35-56-22]|jgi:4-diphosphocytidyl-2-C-methyl-D-erythritol kinase|uniref:4-(cytidine 5'-diphospho)-2-C-methyl-D-erythritol kinase n=1 Tax=Sphingorhabdus sp. TaxID=1902408 RepID=UPI000BC82AB6|nr:4-(cytidine 5'-diphospho)-2-C-methyl-D-erythritol kinase [Sphingorhabdus sp.]OYY15516.1 MAG: 4-(cytidine 5'-diphospho)-2-C-methyl-D-erythritol kinase [Sphingomonadales bacterium 35-56-22]OYY98732.1 MAG: 4-(cytidine 5'-diphospho)-2-C-methyl-D-erythritol kinase [Sphingomonadales bacterium 28-56-43]OYZ60981.1 MAG: 4-(cytidine 5'-diphospho)-2-C-methyl-D-erythritol kinase [Sphingomonadales bacterium 24-56-14]OZA83861.1 MAG: 4-(cytidine 5'-diphospho)-2-C-methyl-D-erythritol kinase [Sphingomonadale